MISNTIEGVGFLLGVLAARTLFGDGVAEAVAAVELVIVGMAIDGVAVNVGRVTSFLRGKRAADA